MTTMNKTPETFVAGETVTFWQGESRRSVEVISVDGNEVIANVAGELMLFAPRESDGWHVALGESEFAVMPDMIRHPKPVPPVKVPLWDRIAEFFA
jgi:hypothetical protein